MKKWLYSTVIMLGLYLQANAQVEKTREVSETYTVSTGDHVNFSSKYGDVHINTWDKNTIEIKATITAKKRSESRAQEALDQVEHRHDHERVPAGAARQRASNRRKSKAAVAGSALGIPGRDALPAPAMLRSQPPGGCYRETSRPRPGPQGWRSPPRGGAAAGRPPLLLTRPPAPRQRPQC